MHANLICVCFIRINNYGNFCLLQIHLATSTRNFAAKYNVTALQKEIPSAARQLQWKDEFDTVYVATDSGVSFYN